MTATITIDPGGVNETTIGPGRIDSVDSKKIHTGLSDFNAVVTYDTDLSDLRGSEVHITDAATDFFFRGFLLRTEDFESATEAHTSISGRGIEHDLERNGNEKTYQNIYHHDAIDDYWTNQTGFTATVTDHTADDSTTDETIQSASTNAEFTAILTDQIDDQTPLAVQNTNIEMLQSAFFLDANEFSGASGSTGFSNQDGYNNGSYRQFDAVGESCSWQFTTDYDIPADQFEVRCRAEVSGSGGGGATFTIDLDGTTLTDNYIPGTSLDWDFPTSYNQLVSAGTHTITFTANAVTMGEESRIDAVVPMDGRYTYTFDNTLSSTQGYLDGPEELPENVEIEFDLAPSTWSVTQASVSSTWDDTTGDQRIQLKLPPSGSYGPTDGTEDNTASLTDFGFGSDVGTAVQARVRFSRYGSRSSTSPLTGFSGQKLQSWTLTIDGNDIPTITDTTYEGSDLEILQQLHTEGRMRYTVEHADGSKNVDSYPVGGIVKAKPDWTVISTNQVHDIGSRYANDVTVRGQRDADGNRLKQTLSDATGVANFGRIHWDEKNPRLETQTEVDRFVRQLLKRRLSESTVTAEREIASIDIQPGYSYPVTLPDGTGQNVASEEVHYSVRDQDVTGRILFNVRATQLQEQLNDVGTGLTDTKLAF